MAAQLSFAGGIVLWPLFFLLLLLDPDSRREQRLFALGAALLLFVATQIAYFHDPGAAAEASAESLLKVHWHSPILVLRYLFAFLTTGILHAVSDSQAAALGLFLCCPIAVLGFSMRKRVAFPVCTALACLLLYPLVLALLAGAARELTDARADRYVLYGISCPTF